ncbi:hypothetical protein I0C86_19460 [Plantactinospora sp. S1510]|uniref:Uncharacterized protein n=1 Tax=Plantactinospora alkalitolerans TaxID=2789879 RepID=A0ABS0GY29_9ACTN|nr:hypothetical protein [Plantactinospora alkalitolerans]MBF9131121.1 hypothetical protein [Plantactinospora alkalitolerans]
MPDSVFEDLYRDTEQVHWASTSEVQHRARQLARRRTLTVLATALVLLVGGGTGVLTALADSGTPNLPDVVATAPVTPTATPPVTPPNEPTITPSRPASDAESRADRAIPAAAMLQGSDVPSGFRPSGQDVDGDWTLNFLLSALCESKDPWPHPGRKIAERGQSFTNGQRSLLQRVDRYAGQDAKRALAAVRTNVNNCVARDRAEISIVGQGFAGEESLLVYSENEGLGNLLIFVRQGDLLAEIWRKDGTDRADALRLADRAAARLCVGTNVC